MNSGRDYRTPVSMPLAPILRSDSERVKDKKITDLFRRVEILERRLGDLLQELDDADLVIAKLRYQNFLIKTKDDIFGGKDDTEREEEAYPKRSA